MRIALEYIEGCRYVESKSKRYLLKYIAIVKTYLKTDVYNLLTIVFMFIIHPQQH